MQKQPSHIRMFALRVLFLGIFAVCARLAIAGELPEKNRSDAAPLSVSKKAASEASASTPGAVEALEEKVARQQAQIEKLTRAVELLSQRLNQTEQAFATETPHPAVLGQVSSLTPVILASATTARPASSASLAVPAAGAPATAAQVEEYTKKVDALGKTVENLNKGIAGFKFSGDLRYRFDGIWRSSNSLGGPQQNFRERYRARLNVDKAIDDHTSAHLQLGSGTFNNPLTFDTDFAGVNNRGPIFITEFHADYHPSKVLGFRAGKMQEAFATGDRFFFDDDVRFNGFQETVTIPLGKNALGIKSVQFLGGQYILTNPNVQVLPSASACAGANPPASCAFLAAGFQPGQKVRDANLFDQGFKIVANINERWSHEFTSNFQWWRNPNEIALASTAAGFPVLVNPVIGLVTSSPLPGTGNATTTKGGAIFTARHFQVGRVAYRLNYAGFKTSRQNFPVWLEVEGARNFGTSFARNAWMATLSVGEVKKLGDVRFLYAYAYKDASSMISQVTDDDLGTGTGVNIRTHHIRVDIGLNKFLEWDNKLFIQDPVRGNDPARNLFVTVPKGVNTAYRVQSEFMLKF